MTFQPRGHWLRVIVIWVVALIEAGGAAGVAVAAVSCDCKLADRHLRAAQALETVQLHRKAQEQYLNVLTSKCCCELTAAVEGFVRTTRHINGEDVAVARGYLKLGLAMSHELRFAEARSYLEKVNAPETRLELLDALEALNAAERRPFAIMWVGARSLGERGLSFAWAVLLLAICLVVRAAALCRALTRVRPLDEVGGGTIGRSFAEVLETIDHEVRRPLRPGSASPSLVLAERPVEFADVSMKIWAFDIQRFMGPLWRLVWPSRFVVEGTVLPSGTEKVAEVRLARSRWIGPRRTMSRWSFRFPAAEDEARMRAIRLSAYSVLFVLLRS